MIDGLPITICFSMVSKWKIRSSKEAIKKEERYLELEAEMVVVDKRIEEIKQQLGIDLFE